MLVPLRLLTAVLLAIEALIICCPGAQMSTASPKLLNDALESAMVDAATVIASFTRAGDEPFAS
jgi:hypothetical protein